MEYIDLRSDTVTKPTPQMYEAMAKAQVGDDVYGEDPTVNRLQEMAAEMMGQERGLFVASGTMGNLSAILAHCNRGDEVIVGNKSHTFLFEAGGISALGGIHSYQLTNQPDGSISLEDIKAAIRPNDIHAPITKLICLENTHNRCGGTYQSSEYIHQICNFGHNLGLKVHLDGARIFNAAVATGIVVKELTSTVDSITFCLSKGLCAPIGSVLCGSKDFITKAHRIRKMLGGGMRQAGVVAAAGIVALESMTTRISEDHVRAKKLGQVIAQIPGIQVDNYQPATNMVFCSLKSDILLDSEAISLEMRKRGILVGVTGTKSFRLVTHYWIDDFGINKTGEAFHEVLINGMKS